MKIDRLFKAALLGLSLAVSPIALEMVQAETLRVVRKNTESTLNVAMNRAVVVESETPFAELSIANPAIADISSLSDRTIYVLGKTPGLTTLTILDANGQLITNVTVHVAPDITEFKERLQQILPGEKIEVRTANDGVVLSGTVSSSARLQRALDLAERYAEGRVSNLMNVAGIQQVMMKVRFAEMNRTVSKALSASLAIEGTVLNGDLGIDLNTGTFLDGANSATFPPLVTPQAGQEGTTLFGWNSGNLEIGLFLEALEQKGAVRFLAEPNLIALSGQEASFLAGGEFPIPVAQDDDTITIEFKPFGVGLNFIPTVVDKDIINLQMEASVSAVDETNSINTDGIAIPAFSTRETNTTIELRDGQSFAVAGLLQDDFSDLNNQVPWLGDVPVLGTLFRSANYQRSQTELVIIVTAHLVSPVNGDVLALPTDRIKPPSERDLFLFGRTTAGTRPPQPTGAVGEVAKQDFSGSYGYVLD